MFYRRGYRYFALFSAILVAEAASVPAMADGVADFFKSRTITIYAGSSAGGGYDRYARALGRYIGKHIPGNPQIINSNMPGGTGLKLTNWLYNVAPKDGTAMGMVGRGIAVHEMLGGVGAKFDAGRMNWIGSMNSEVSVCVTHQRSPVKSLSDLMKTEAAFGTQGASSDTEVFAVFLKNLTGAKVKVISGYPGTKETVLAMERGEVDGMCGWSWTSLKQQKPDWVRNKTVNILLQMALTKHPDLQSTPLITELADNDTERAQVKLVFSRQTMGRPLVAPQELPGARVAALRAAFDATMEDPEFLAYARKAKMEVEPVSGTKVQELVASVLATPKDVVMKAISNLKTK